MHKLPLPMIEKAVIAQAMATHSTPTSAPYLLESGNEIMGVLSFRFVYPRYLPKVFDVHVPRQTYGLLVCSLLGC